MRYFDSRETAITARHIMASGALPPAFPAVRIDGELYWDGGILSNTPTEAIFDDNPRRNSLIFAVHMWNPMGSEPETIWEVLHRHKDIQYSSRVASHITRQRQVHKLRHVVSELVKFIPEDERNDPVVKDLAEYGCRTQMHVVRLLAPRLDNENHTKDIDFSPNGHSPALGSGLCRHDACAATGAPGTTIAIRSKASFCTSPCPISRWRRNKHRAYRGKTMPNHDAIIIGTGQSGPPLAARLSGAGMREVAVIEQGKFGGTCVNNGCIPTKTLVASAYAARLAHRAGAYGVENWRARTEWI